MIGRNYVARATPRYVLGSIAGEALTNAQELLVISGIPAAWPALLTNTASSVQILGLKLGENSLPPTWCGLD